MKKLFSVLLAVLIVFGITACRNGNVVDVPGIDSNIENTERLRETPPPIEITREPLPTTPPIALTPEPPVFISPYINEKLVGRWMFWDSIDIETREVYILNADGTGTGWTFCPVENERITIDIIWEATDNTLTTHGRSTGPLTTEFYFMEEWDAELLFLHDGAMVLHRYGHPRGTAACEHYMAARREQEATRQWYEAQ